MSNEKQLHPDECRVPDEKGMDGRETLWQHFRLAVRDFLNTPWTSKRGWLRLRRPRPGPGLLIFCGKNGIRVAIARILEDFVDFYHAGKSPAGRLPLPLLMEKKNITSRRKKLQILRNVDNFGFASSGPMEAGADHGNLSGRCGARASVVCIEVRLDTNSELSWVTPV